MSLKRARSYLSVRVARAIVYFPDGVSHSKLNTEEGPGEMFAK